MRAILAFGILALLLALPAAAGEEEDAIKRELMRLRGRVQALLDRVEALEQTLDRIDGGAGRHDWVPWGDRRIPPRRDYAHAYAVRKTGTGLEVGKLLLVPVGAGSDCLRDAMLKVSLRVSRKRPRAAPEARFTLSFRHPRGRPPAGVKANVAVKRYAVLAEDRVLVAGETRSTMSTAESGGLQQFVQTAFTLDLDAFLQVLPYRTLTLAFRPEGDPKACATFRLAPQVLEALNDLASRLADRKVPTDAPPAAAEDVPSTDPKGGKGLPRLKGCAFPRRRSRAGLKANGGGVSTERAVESALEWLAVHQSPDGRWEAAGFMRWANGKRTKRGPDGAGKSLYDVGVTGLALLAFLGAGYTQLDMHPYGSVVARGLQYLRGVQDREGCVGTRRTQHYIYAHAAGAQAIVDAYAMTKDESLWASAQAAIDFTCVARNPYFAWRYGVKPGDNDTSVTGWTGSVLHLALLSNESTKRTGVGRVLRIDKDAPDGITAWLVKMTDRDYGRTGYIQRGGAPARPQELIHKFPGDRSEAMTAVALWLRVAFGEDPDRSQIIRKGAELCAKLPPTWNVRDGSIDFYYWYYGTLAMHQVGGRYWTYWNRRMREAVGGHQRKDTTPAMYEGSWDPIGPWGPDGGRVYATALGALMLETYYRYDRSSD